MITTIRRLCNLVVLLLLFIHSNSQDLRSFNQNSSRSNNARALSISMSPVYSSSTAGNKDSLLFRGSGSGFRVGGDYFFGKAGIGFNTGFSSSSANDAAINSFLKNNAVPQDQMLITKAKQQNMYLLLGPSVRFGNKVELYAHAKGGVFINNGGLISMQQRGAQRVAYRNESTDKNIYPGFLTGLSVQYKTKSDAWSFGIGADYMSTKSEVNNYDARRGGGVEALKLSGSIQDIVAGVSVRYNIFSPRDHSSGQSTGKRDLGKPKYEDVKAARDVSSGMSTGRRVLPTVNKREIAIDEPGVQKTLESCGPVTQRITNADGTTEEMTFSCPADAANYASQMKMDGAMPNRISMNVTVPKQTQGATFGEKVNQGLHAAGGALSQGASMSIISGTLTWGSSNTGGIITNKAIYNGSTTRGGSTTMNSQTSSTRQTNQSSFGTIVRLSARDHASGQATGKRSRENGSGQATGRRQYEPIFAEGQNDVCNTCPATAKMSGAKSNPLYSEKGVTGENPFYEGNKKAAGGEDEDCDGVADANIFLIDAGSGAVVAKTKTEECGDFFFANVPEGNYFIKVSGSFTGKKGYDVYVNPKTIGSKSDLAGGITATDDWDVQLLINTSKGNDEMAQKAGISTSRSNIRTKSLIIIEADLDGDGEYESLKATGTFSDGSTRDITAAARKTVSNAAGTKGIILDGNAFQMTRRRVEVLKSNKQGEPNANRLTSILVTTGSRLTAIGNFSDGSNRDITEGLISNTDHLGVRQYSITVGDSDDDGIADAVIKTKTKSNQSNDRIANEDADDGNGLINAKAKITKSRSNIQNNRMANDDEEDVDSNNGLINAKAKITKSRSNIQNNRMNNDEESDDIWSPRSNIKMLNVTNGDVDGDGKADLVSGNKLKNYFENGDTPTESQRRPGEPIPGIDVKLGKNPGGQSMQTITSNEYGEFEFTNLDAGNYIVTVEQKIFIEDETFIVLGGNNTRAQDHNSSRSNKSGIIDNDPDNVADAARKGWDGTVKGGSKTKAQDHNSSRSNKTSNIVANDNDPDDTENPNSVLSESDAKKPITFRWAQAVPRGGGPVTYRLKVWQLMQGQNGTQAMRSNRPITEKSVTNTTETSVQGILTGPCRPPYLCDFIWSVQAFNSEGKVINDSQTKSFSVGSGGGGSSTKAQDHNSSRSNKTSSIIANDNDPDDTKNPVTKLQNNNTVRSNRIDNALIDNPDNNTSGNITIDEAGTSKGKEKSDPIPVKWTAPESMRAAIKNSHSNIKNILASLDQLDQQLNADKNNEKSIVNTSRSNIKSQRTAINDLNQMLDKLQTTEKDIAMNELDQRMSAMNMQFLSLQESLTKLGQQYTSISNVLKTRHDVAMNAIRNMK